MSLLLRRATLEQFSQRRDLHAQRGKLLIRRLLHLPSVEVANEIIRLLSSGPPKGGLHIGTDADSIAVPPE